MQPSATAAREAAAAALAVRPASLDDLPAIMAIERTPGFDQHVGRSEEAEHRAMLASPAYAYRLGFRAGAEGFAILGRVGDAHGNLYLKRIAVSRPGEGSERPSSASSWMRRLGRSAPNASSSTASWATPAPSAPTRSSASPATASCERPTARPTVRERTSC